MGRRGGGSACRNPPPVFALAQCACHYRSLFLHSWPSPHSPASLPRWSALFPSSSRATASRFIMAVGGESLVQPAAKVAQGSGELGKPIKTAAAWTATSALAEKEQWVLELSPEQVDEILQATKHATATGKPVQVGMVVSRAPPAAGCAACWRSGGRCRQNWLALPCISEVLRLAPPALNLPNARCPTGGDSGRLPAAHAGAGAGEHPPVGAVWPRLPAHPGLPRGPPVAPGGHPCLLGRQPVLVRWGRRWQCDCKQPPCMAYASQPSDP